jgi:hypothetical protein
MKRNHDLTRRTALQAGLAGVAIGSSALAANAIESREHLRVRGIVADSASFSGEKIEGEFAVDPVSGDCRLIQTVQVCSGDERSDIEHSIADGDHVRSSQDGSQLAFIRRTTNEQQIVVTDAQQQHRRVVWNVPAALSATDVCFSPSDRQIAVTVQRLERLENKEESGETTATQLPVGCELVVLGLASQAICRVPMPEADYLDSPNWRS